MKTASLIRKNKQLNIGRKAMPFAEIRRALILWDAGQARTDIEELKSFGHALRSSGIDITFLSFYPLKKLKPDMKSNELYRLCCKGDFNMFGAPRSASLKALLEEPFDLLINGCLSDHEYLKTIAVYSKAGFRVGPYLNQDDLHCYELLIRPNGADPCENYLIESGRYLRKMK